MPGCAGGVLVAFPAGGASTAGGPFAKAALDAPGKPFTARAIIETGARVLPVFFGGQNSRLFQIASHVSQTLREALLFHDGATSWAPGSTSRSARRSPSSSSRTSATAIS